MYAEEEARTTLDDREEVVDALLRMVEGIDTADREVLRSAFAEDVTFDLSGLASTAATYEPYHGRDFTIERLVNAVGRLDTMHAVTNIRVFLDGDTARATSYLIGQHFRPGEGPSADFGDHLWRGNRFVTDFVRADAGWVVQRHVATTMWNLGNVAATRLDAAGSFHDTTEA